MFGAITGILASRNADGASEFFTSALYPYVLTENVSIQLPNLQKIQELGAVDEFVSIGLPTLTGGSLVDNLKTYNTQTENVAIALPSITGGSLVDSIVYKTYSDYATENVSINLPTLTGGSFATTIAYVNYTYPSENVSINLPIITSGSLT